MRKLYILTQFTIEISGAHKSNKLDYGHHPSATLQLVFRYINNERVDKKRKIGILVQQHGAHSSEHAVSSATRGTL